MDHKFPRNWTIFLLQGINWKRSSQHANLRGFFVVLPISTILWNSIQQVFLKIFNLQFSKLKGQIVQEGILYWIDNLSQDIKILDIFLQKKRFMLDKMAESECFKICHLFWNMKTHVIYISFCGILFLPDKALVSGDKV